MALAARQTQSAGDTILDLAQDPFKQEIQGASMITAFALYLGVAFGLTVLFSLVRPRHRLVYAPKTKHADEAHAPPPLGNGFLSWLKPVTTTKEDYLMDRIGLDAVLFLRFTRMCRNIFLSFGVVGLAIMLPVNVTQTKGASNDNNNYSSLMYMTPAATTGSALWVQVVVAYLGNFIVCYFLWHNYRRVLRLRRTYFQSAEYQNSLHARTLVVRDLKPDLRNEQGVVRVTDENNPTGVQPKVTTGRNVKDLPDLIEDHEETVRELESVLAKYLKNPDRLPAKRPTMKPSSKSRYSGSVSGGKVDSIEYLTERIRELEAEISQLRERVDSRDPMPYAFVSWDHIAQAHSVAFASRNKTPLGARLDLAPRPTDIIWKNLSIGKSARSSRRFMNAVWISVLTVVWLPLNAAISIFLSNLGNLGAVWPSFDKSFNDSPKVWGIVQAVLAPTIISLVYMVLPVIFRRLQIRAGDITKTEREQHVVRNLYTFFTLNNLVLFSIFSAVWQFVATIIQNPNRDGDVWDTILRERFFHNITEKLCTVSSFWVTFLLQRNLGAATDLVQFSRILVTTFQRKFLSPTPRQTIEWTAPVAFDYASYYNYFLFYATIALAFANLQPIILLIAALYFLIDSVLKKYLMLYVFVTKNETGGQLWRTLFNRLIFAAMLSDVVVAVLLVANDQYIMVGVLAPALLILLGFKMYCLKTFDKDMKYYATSGLVDQESLEASGKQRRRAEKVSAKFGHPALWKPLMTPMVHAKAKHIIGDIYKGRMTSDAGAQQAGGFSDNFAMQPMGATAGKAANAGPAPFEFVSEAQQDFAYYKNRDDFREEGGNLYGRPDDAMTERSVTPMGFKGNMGQYSEYSVESSRANSPSPVRRKELVGQSEVHPALRPGYMDSQTSLNRFDTSDSRDMGLGPRAGQYTDPDDDRTNLLNYDVSMSQFQTPRGPLDSGTPGSEGGGYDYFRRS